MTLDLAFIRAFTPDLLRGAWITLVATAGGMAIAIAVGLMIAVVLRISVGTPIPRLLGTLTRFVRGTPLLVQLYALFYILPLAGPRLGPLATGIAALGLHHGAFLSDVFRAGIDGVPTGQHEAARALGLTGVARWRFVILPQAIPPVLPVLGNTLIGMFKDTPLLATITVIDLFGAAEQIAGTTYRYTEPMTMVGILFLALSVPCAIAVRALEHRGGRGRR